MRINNFHTNLLLLLIAVDCSFSMMPSKDFDWDSTSFLDLKNIQIPDDIFDPLSTSKPKSKEEGLDRQTALPLTKGHSLVNRFDDFNSPPPTLRSRLRPSPSPSPLPTRYPHSSPPPSLLRSSPVPPSSQAPRMKSRYDDDYHGTPRPKMGPKVSMPSKKMDWNFDHDDIPGFGPESFHKSPKGVMRSWHTKDGKGDDHIWHTKETHHHHHHHHHHASEEDHEHEHGHKHDGWHKHDHGHEHEHGHEHGHDHEHDHDHGHAHNHGHGHEQSHQHDHGHTHGHEHKHSHGHQHGHNHGHGHAHAHNHDHGHKHTHGHEHAHDNKHSHAHGHEHWHDHDHKHGHDHHHHHDHEHSSKGHSKTEEAKVANLAELLENLHKAQEQKQTYILQANRPIRLKAKEKPAGRLRVSLDGAAIDLGDIL